MESIRSEEKEDVVQKYYWELGRRIHHDKNFMDFDLAEVLSVVGVSNKHLTAYENSSFDEEIRTRMNAGITCLLYTSDAADE